MIDVIDWIESRRTSAYGKTGVKQTWRNVARNVAVTARFFSRIRFNIVEVIERNKSQGVKPREEDVPGAILPRKIPEERTVKKLQRWLLYRGAKTTGKKVLVNPSLTLAPSSTSKPCVWSFPRKRGVDNLPNGLVKFRRHQHGKPIKSEDESPTSKSDV